MNFCKSYEMIFMVLKLSNNSIFSATQQFGIQITPLVDIDVGEVSECLYDSFKSSKDRFFKELSKEEVTEDYKRRIDPIEVINKASIAITDGINLIGFGLVKDRDFDTHLDLLCVNPVYRNKDYSKILMQHIID